MHEAQRAAEESLVSILEAAKQVQLVGPADSRMRDLVFSAVLDAASGGVLAERLFTSDTGTAGVTDWIANSRAAALELNSARVLSAIAAVRGEIRLESSEAPENILSNAILQAEDELGNMTSLSPQRQFSGLGSALSSNDVGSALSEFRKSASETADGISDNSEKVISVAFEQLKKHGTDVVNAFRSVEQMSSWVESLSEFIQRAWEKVKSAFQFLQELSKSIPTDWLSAKLEYLRGFTDLRRDLDLLYESGATRSAIDNIRVRTGITPPEIDNFTLEAIQLNTRFATFCKTLKAIMASLTMIGLLAAHFGPPAGVLLVPAGSALVAGVTIGAGFDYLGKIRISTRMRGLQQLLSGVNTEV